MDRKLKSPLSLAAALAVIVLAALLSSPLLTAAELGRPAQGKLLVAGPDLVDPNFARTVILLVDYGPHGAMGLVVNRPMDATLAEAWPEAEVFRERRDPIYLGGPVAPTGMAMLLRSDGEPEGARRVFRDVFFSTRRELLEEVVQGGVSDERLRVFAGYAGWGPGQLDFELERGGWIVTSATADAVFSDAPHKVWERLARGRTGIVAALEPPR